MRNVNSSDMKERLIKSTALIGSMTTLSRVAGLIRDILCAQFFGASIGYDAFLVAFRIPNLFRALFAEGAFSQAFVPLLTQHQQTESHEDLHSFVNKVSGCLALISGFVVVLGIIFSEQVIHFVAPGFGGTSQRFVLASQMLKIIFPYLFFIALTALSAGILNTFKRFWSPAFAPVLLNASLIIGIVFVSHFYKEPILVLAYAVTLSGVLQLLLQLPFLKRINLIPKLKPDFKDKRVQLLLKKMLPAIFGVSIVQLNLLMSTVYASFLMIGSVSWLYYADRMVQFPLGVFGVALATVILPQLSRKALDNSNTNYKKILAWGVRLTCLIAFPASIGLFILAPSLIKFIFEYGSFSANDSVQTTLALQAYSFGLLAFILIKIGATAFYARRDIKTPVKIGCVALLVNALLSLVLMRHYGHVGLAASTAISSWVNAGLLLVLLMKRKLLIFNKKNTAFILQVMGSGLVMGYFLSALQPHLYLLNTLLLKIIALSAVILAAIIIYLLVLKLLKFKWSLLQEPI